MPEPPSPELDSTTANDVEMAITSSRSLFARSRKDRPTGSTHFGDIDFIEEKTTEIAEASWREVCQSCCIHPPKVWAYIIFCLLAVLVLLYCFLFGLDLLAISAKVLSGCTAGSLFGNDKNPLAALVVGILCTVLIQSSSTTTSIIVSLVGSDTIGIKSAIYMVMGANIGTSVTNTIVVLGHLGDGDELERAFAGATVHDIFNLLSATILFIIELVTQYLYYLTKAMLPSNVRKGKHWEGPIKQIVAPLVDRIIIANSAIIKHVASGGSCSDFYPTKCADSVESYKSCQTGLIGCSSTTNRCPLFFQDKATQKDDEVSGGVCFFIALVILIVCLLFLVTILQRMLMGMSTRIIYKATNINGYLAMVVGCGITMLVQSSSITTSVLVPFVGMGIIRLEQMYPLTLGANLGTTTTALMASMVSEKVEALQIALCHLFFNVSGILIWYPIPFMRKVPLNVAKALGKMTRIWRGFPIVYIITVFFLFPLLLLGLSVLFEKGTIGFTALGCVLAILIALLIVWVLFKWYRGGKEMFIAYISVKEKEKKSFHDLPDDISFLKHEISVLKEFVGFLDDEQEGQ